jgi:Tfp pilus assembly protein PilN
MIKINLLPRERARRRFIPPQVGVVAASLVVVGFAVVSWIYLSALNATVRRQVDDVNQKIEVLRPRVARVEELQRQIAAAERKAQLLRQLEGMRIAWDGVLIELRNKTPTDVWLIMVEARDDGGFVFNGFGMSYEAVARLMISLEQSPRFQSVDLTIGQKQALFGRDVINFSLTARLTPGQEARAP